MHFITLSLVLRHCDGTIAAGEEASEAPLPARCMCEKVEGKAAGGTSDEQEAVL